VAAGLLGSVATGVLAVLVAIPTGLLFLAGVALLVLGDVEPAFDVIPGQRRRVRQRVRQRRRHPRGIGDEAHHSGVPERLAGLPPHRHERHDVRGRARRAARQQRLQAAPFVGHVLENNLWWVRASWWRGRPL